MFKNFIIIILMCFSIIANAQQTTVNKSHIHKILLVVAMDKEAQPIISTLNLKHINFSKLPMQGYIGKYNNLEILLVTNGLDPINKVQNVGTQAATLTTYLGIQYFHPDLVISIGTAGGVEKDGAKLGEIIYSEKIYFFDRRFVSKNDKEYGLGGYPSAVFTDIDKKLGLKSGIVCSGDSFDDNQTDYNMFITEHCTAIDMEAAGVAWVSMLTKTPMFAMKGITNFVKGEDIHDQYRKNFSTVTLELANKLKELLKYLSSDL